MNPEKPKGPSQERRQDDGELVFSFNSPVTKDDEILLEAIMFAIHGPQAHLEIEKGSSEQDIIIRGNQFQLNRIGEAFHNREWENNPEMKSKVDGYLHGKKFKQKRERDEFNDE